MSPKPFLCCIGSALVRLRPHVLICALIATALGHPLAALGGSTFAGVVNLNNASQQELEQLPGVGPSKASRILQYRQRRPFRTVGELVRVKGFGAKTFQRLRPYLTVTAPTQLKSEAANAACTCTCPSEAQAAAEGSSVQAREGARKPQPRGDRSM